jgi:hypothetical protein
MCTVLLPPGVNPIAVLYIYIYIYIKSIRMRREDNIKMGFEKEGWGKDWIDLA